MTGQTMLQRRDFLNGLIASAVAAGLPLPTGVARALEARPAPPQWVAVTKWVVHVDPATWANASAELVEETPPERCGPTAAGPKIKGGQ